MNGVKFDSYHSYSNLGMVLTSKNIPLPSPKTYVVDIPGGDGKLDLTTALTDGYVKYENRPIEMKFTCMSSNATSARSDIANKIHGRVMKLTFDDDKNFYYKGRVTIDEFNTDDARATLTISADCDPYKYKQSMTEKSVDSPTSGADVSLTIPALKFATVPKIYSQVSSASVVYKNKNYALTSGYNIIPGIILGTSETVLTFKNGNGSRFDVYYQEGEL